MTVRLAVVSAGLSDPSSTRLLATQLAEATDRALRLHDEQAEISVIDLRGLAHALTDHLLTGFAAGDLAKALDAVREADAVIAVSPVFTASFSGLFKTFLDVLEEGTLDGKPVLVGATGGTARHSLALEYAIRPVLAYLRADVVPTVVFAATEDFGTGGGAGGLAARIERAGRELAEAALRHPRQRRADPFDDPTPFEELLGR